MVNPVVGRALTNRLSLAKIRVQPANLGAVAQCNPYSALFNMTGDNLAALSAMMDNVSKFTENAKLGSETLLQLIGDASGITCLSHSLEPPTLPTWHKLATATTADNLAQCTDEQYAQDVYFMRPKILANANLPVPTAGQCVPALALVQSIDCTLNNNPIPTATFDPHFNVYSPPCIFNHMIDQAVHLTIQLLLASKLKLVNSMELPFPSQMPVTRCLITAPTIQIRSHPSLTNL